MGDSHGKRMSLHAGVCKLQDGCKTLLINREETRPLIMNFHNAVPQPSGLPTHQCSRQVGNPSKLGVGHHRHRQTAVEDTAREYHENHIHDTHDENPKHTSPA